MNAVAAGTVVAGDGFAGIRARWRMAFLLHRELGDREQRVASLMLEMTSRQLWQQQGQVLTWVSVPALAAAQRQCDRTVQRARAVLVRLGVLKLARQGGHGRRDASAFAFDPAWLDRAEDRLRSEGAFAALGMAQWPPGEAAQPDSPVTLNAFKGDRCVALNADSDAVPAGAPKGDRTVALNQSWGDSAAAAPKLKGDSAAAGGLKGDTSVTLSAAEAEASVTVRAAKGDSVQGDTVQGGRTVALNAKIVEKSVEELLAETPVADFRVTNRVAKGDKSGQFRVTDLSPEPLTKPGSNLRARARGSGGHAAPSCQRSLMLPITGGLGIPPDGLDQARNASKARSDARRDQRAVELLDRATAILEDRGKANLAVSCMDGPTKAAIIAGRPIADDALAKALRHGLASFDTSYALNAGTGPPAIPMADLVAALRQVLPELLGPLIAAVGALLPEPFKPLVAEALKRLSIGAAA